MTRDLNPTWLVLGACIVMTVVGLLLQEMGVW
jgi:hypothetical protein